jgi:ketosteroid isomerase-like protein
MSQENMDLIRRAFAAFNRGGVDACINEGVWSPEIVWDATPSGIPGLGVFRGQEVKRFFDEDWFRAFPFDEWEVKLEEVIAAPEDRVITMSRQHGRGASSGAVAELELAQIATVRDGRVVRIDNYLDRKKALRAAGLAE